MSISSVRNEIPSAAAESRFDNKRGSSIVFSSKHSWRAGWVVPPPSLIEPLTAYVQQSEESMGFFVGGRAGSVANFGREIARVFRRISRQLDTYPVTFQRNREELDLPIYAPPRICNLSDGVGAVALQSGSSFDPSFASPLP